MDMRTRRPFPADYHDYVNTEEGWVDRRIFWEEEIYQQELEKIFARSWHFIAHDSQIPKTGDFVTTYMGEDGVIGVRDKGGQVRVFLNSCPHRGNKVCYADSGNSKNFTCNYHGWAFGMDGSLLGIHNEHIYEGDINKADWGLREARVSTYKGLVFANFDMDKAIEGTMRSAFANCGQVCLDTERVYVERSIFDEFVGRLKKAAEGLMIGPPDDAEANLGPLVSLKHKKKSFPITRKPWMTALPLLPVVVFRKCRKILLAGPGWSPRSGPLCRKIPQ
jgi:nitrite reductase/ring-hydroxylating ferredoxin subunit